MTKDSKKIGSDKQFYIVGANGERDLLVEVESASDVDSWVSAIREHINYANRRGSVVDASEAAEAAMASSGSTGKGGSGKGGSGKSRLQSVSAAEFPVVPSPGFVIKVLRTNGEKIFVNLCEAAEVPMMNVSIGFNKWPFMIMTPVRTIQEEKEGSGGSAEISVYDAIVNPAVLVTCGKNPEAKDAVSEYMLDSIRSPM